MPDARGSSQPLPAHSNNSGSSGSSATASNASASHHDRCRLRRVAPVASSRRCTRPPRINE